MDFAGADFTLAWPPSVFIAEGRSLLSGNRPSVSGWASRVERLLEEAFVEPTPTADFRDAGGFAWPADHDSKRTYLHDLVAAAEAGKLPSPTKVAPYWPQRQASRESPVIGAENVRRTFTRLVAEFSANGYLESVFPSDCVDAHDFVPVNESDLLEARLGIADLWPLDRSASSWDEDTFYGVIEVFHDLVARPRRRSYHDYSNCGWHYEEFVIEPARQLYRARVNDLLAGSVIPLRLAEVGEDTGRLVAVTDEARGDLIERLVTSADPTDADRVRHAIALYRSRGATIEDKRSAIIALAGVFESRRALIHQRLLRKDEDALFQIANQFSIRHQNESQKADYDPAFLDWVFWLYAATVELTDRLRARVV